MESLHYLLMKTHTILNRQILNCAGKVGLTAGQPKVLEFLSQHGESDQKTIASYCEIEPATVGSILLRMERSGLVVRQQHEGNRRSLFVSLTEQGEQAAAAVAEIFRETETAAASGLSAEELEQLKGLLDRLWRSMETHRMQHDSGEEKNEIQ